MKRMILLVMIFTVGCGDTPKKPLKMMDGRLVRATKDQYEAKCKFCDDVETPATVIRGNDHVIMGAHVFNDSMPMCSEHYLKLMKPGDPSLEEIRRHRDE